jgi:FkbM family methyltransferase
MLNVRKNQYLRGKSVLGKLLRIPFLIIPAKKVLRIFFGRLAGKKWIWGSHNRSVCFGIYERNQTKSFYESAKTATVFWDLGAHAGYYTLLFKTCSVNGIVHAFEPLPKNIQNLRTHIALNNLSQVYVHEVAVFDKEGQQRFKSGKTSVAGRINESGDLVVPVVKLSDLVGEGVVKMADLIKMDIEGAEINVLRDLQPIIQAKRPTIFLSTHGKQVHQQCISLLSEIGYAFTPLDTPDLNDSREILANYQGKD